MSDCREGKHAHCEEGAEEPHAGWRGGAGPKVERVWRKMECVNRMNEIFSSAMKCKTRCPGRAG